MSYYLTMLSVGGGQGTDGGFGPTVSGFESRRLHTMKEETMSSVARVLSFVADKAEPVVETTHETFVQAVRAAVVSRVNSETERARLLGAKLVYGAARSVRGRCFPGAWKNGETHDFLEISACNEESFVQLAGTTIHELGHSLAGAGAGHGRAWKKACAVLGLRAAEASGQAYAPDHFEASVWAAIERLPHPSDGRPQFQAFSRAPRTRPCPLGIGTRGGTSRGIGSGSRMRLYVCGCPEGTIGRKVRVASDVWDATCNTCGIRYAKQERPA